MRGGRCRLVSCGILRGEIRCLIEKNRWPVDALFLDSSGHVHLERLEKGLTAVLSRSAGEDVAVFYGACHPLIDGILARAGALRTPVENCIEALLGREVYLREVEAGAFFLLDDWARRAREILLATVGGSEAVAREVFQAERKYLLGIRTPCSGDFVTEAEDASRLVGLPLRWTDVTLENLEAVLRETIERRTGGALCPG